MSTDTQPPKHLSAEAVTRLIDEAFPQIHAAGRVIEIDPPHRLVTSWFSPADEGDEGRTSRVTYEVSAVGEPGGMNAPMSSLVVTPL